MLYNGFFFINVPSIISIFYCTRCTKKIYISNYTLKYMQAYTYSFFLCTEFHVVRMQTKFCQNSAALLCSILFSKLRVCLVGHCWQCRVYISASEPTVPLLCHEPLKQHNVQTQYVVFEVFQFPTHLLSEIFFFSITYLPSYGSNSHRNICGSSSYMSVILSDFSKNCNSWANFIDNSNLKFHEQPNGGFSSYFFCSERQTDKPF